jgi:hypothetical protein
MKKSKYIIVSQHDLEVPVVFCPLFNHKDVKVWGNVVSAGFCNKDPLTGKLQAFGESVSLGIKSRSEDTDILNRYLEADL